MARSITQPEWPIEKGSRPSRPRSAPRGRLLELDRASLRAKAYEAIRGSIVTGEIADNEIYPVSYFAARLGVSATPIREALFDLAGDGLIEVVRNRGFKLPPLSDRDMDELHELRLLIELPAVVRVARERLLSDVRHARHRATEMVGLAERGEVLEFLASDRTFHLELLGGLQNRRLLRLVALLRDQARFRGIRGLAVSGGLVAPAREHLVLLDAMEAGDTASAERHMRSHLAHVRLLWEGLTEGSES